MNLSGKTILLVEDEAVVALMEKRWLKDEGIIVVHALDGQEAIKIVRDNPSAIDLILMDIDLGKGMMDGTDAAREILKEYDIPLIFLSCHTEKEIVEKTESITSYGYVVKGYCETVLLASIKMAFKLHDAYKTISESEEHFKALFEKSNESRKMEKLFLESETKYRLLFENSVDGIILISSDNRILAANPSACRIAGMNEDEIKKHGRYGLCDMTDPRIPLAIEERQNTGRFSGELTYLKKDGTRYPVEVTSAVFRDLNNKEMLYVIFRDVTERNRYEETMRRFTEELENSNAIKDKTLSIVSHDLRGPFAGFSGLTGLLVKNLDRMSKEEIKEIANIMHHTAAETNDLLLKLLEWSKLKRGKLELQQTEVDLFSAVENIRYLFSSSSANKSIRIENKTDKDAKVFTDQNVLSTVLRNLVDNAIKFTPEGGSIIVSSECEDGFIKIKVIDSGIGISKKNIDKIFDIDNKCMSRGTRGEKGSGLGLALCQDMIKRCGGEIKARNHAVSGSEFTFTLPYHEEGIGRVK